MKRIIPVPADYGLPQFDAFRAGQHDLALKIINSTKRVIGVSAPTGFGKSLLYVLAHQIASGSQESRYRTIVLTADKGLQDQVVGDYSNIGMVDIRGRSSFECVELAAAGGDPEHSTCEDGALAKCPRIAPNGFGCPYRMQPRDEDITVTNYSFWAYVNMYGRGMGAIDLLVCDEGHKVPSIIEDMVSVKLKVRSYMKCPKGTDRTEWMKWAKHTRIDVDRDLKDIERSYTSVLHMSHSVRKRLRWLTTYTGWLKRIETLPEDWVIDREGDSVQFNPLWPRTYTENVVFCQVPKVVIISATLIPKTLTLLGLSPADYDFFDVDTDWDSARQPVYYYPSSNMNYNVWKESAGNRVMWADLVDRIIESRTDRKGIIHTVSYEMTKLILERSCHRELMMTHGPGERDRVVADFKAATGPRILVSPSVTTGYDFPGDSCRYQIIAKVPFPSNRDRATLAKARRLEDKDYDNYQAFQVLVQGCGRGRRSADDWCENHVTDSRLGMIWHNKSLVPGWWLRCVKKVEGPVPEPIPLSGPVTTRRRWGK